MADELPTTTKQLEDKIKTLEAKLSASDGLEARLVKRLEDQIAALETKLAQAKEEKPAQREGWSKHFWY